MNLPTKLTFVRIFLIPIFIVLYFLPYNYMSYCALFVFVLASFTDFLDGYLARKNNQVTNLGKFLDPIADKMLVACALIAVSVTGFEKIYALDVLLPVFSMLILCRELMISGFRIVASSKNVVLAADNLGKIKTVLQMVALIVLLPYKELNILNQTVADIVFYVGFSILALATIMTMVSGFNYILKNKEVLKEA